MAIPNLSQSFCKIVRKNLEQPFLAILNLYQSFWEKLLEKIQNSHIWPFRIYTSLFGKNCWKKFRTAIFGHSEFIPVFLRKIVGKNSEQPFLAIQNLYQSFWAKMLEKFQNSHFWPFRIYTSLLGKNCWKKFRTAFFGHSEFIPVFLCKIVGKNSEQPYLAIQNLYQSFWEKLSEKIQNSHIWPFRIYTSLFGKNCQKKFRTAIFGHSEFIPVFLGKIVGKNSELPYLAIQNLYQSFWEKLLEKIQNSHIWPFRIYTSLSGKNCWKNSEQPYLAIQNLYQSFWEKLSGKMQSSHIRPF